MMAVIVEDRLVRCPCEMVYQEYLKYVNTHINMDRL